MIRKLLLIAFLITLSHPLYSLEETDSTTTITVIAKEENGIPLNEVVSNVNKLSDRVIKDSNSSTVNDILEKVPGVSVGVEFKDTIDIRGQGSDKVRRNVQVLIDDMPLNLLDTTHYWPGYNIIPAQSISKVEIIPGGGSVIYGNGVQGGVVNFSTDFTTTNDPVNEFYFGLGSFHTRKTSISLGNNSLINDKLTLQFHYSGENNKAYLRGEYANTDYYSLSAKYKITPNQSIGYVYSEYNEDGLYSGVVSLSKIKKDWRASGTLYDRDRYNEDHKINYKGDFGWLNLENTSFMQDGHWRGLHSLEEEGTFFNNVKGNKAKAKINYDNEGSFLLLGNDLIKYKQQIYTAKNIWEYNKTTIGTFALNKYYIYNGIYSTQGYRFNRDLWDRKSPPLSTAKPQTETNHYKRTIDNQNLEFSLGYEYNKETKFWIRTETGFTAPEANDFTDTIRINNNLTYVMNDIDYEKFITYEIGGESQITPSTYVKLAIFQTDTKNEIGYIIDFDSQNFVTLGNYAVNIGKTRRQGVEINLEQDLFNRVNIFIGGTYTMGRLQKANLAALNNLPNLSQDTLDETLAEWQEKEGKRLAKVPPVSVVGGATIKVIEGLEFTTTLNYLSDYIPNTGVLDPSESNLRIGARTITDIDLRYKKDKNNIGMGVKNLFDKRYFQLNSGGSYATVRQGVERTFYIDYRYKF